MHSPHFNPDDAADAAMQVFWRQGYAATSVQDLVDATGLARSSLYASFASKHGLFASALRRYRAQTMANVALLAGQGSAQALVRQLLQGVADQELHADHQHCGCLVANSALELGGRDREVSALLAGHFAQLEAALTALMRRGQRRGEIARARSATALARFVLATMQGLRVLGRGQADADRAQRLADIIDTAVAAVQ